MIYGRHPAVLGLVVNGNLACQFSAIVVSQMCLKRHRDIVVIDKLTGSYHVANFVIRYGACGSQINNLAHTLFVESLHNDIGIIAIDIARNHEPPLDGCVRKQINIQSFFYQRVALPILLDQDFFPFSFKAKKQRSEERRVGKECRSLWSTCHYNIRRRASIKLYLSSDVCSSDLNPSFTRGWRCQFCSTKTFSHFPLKPKSSQSLSLSFKEIPLGLNTNNGSASLE